MTCPRRAGRGGRRETARQPRHQPRVRESHRDAVPPIRSASNADAHPLGVHPGSSEEHPAPLPATRLGHRPPSSCTSSWGRGPGGGPAAPATSGTRSCPRPRQTVTERGSWSSTGGVEPPLARYASGRHRVRWLGTGKGEESTPARTNGPGLDGSRFSGRCGAPCRNADQPLGLRVASLTDGAGDPAPSAVPPTRRNPLGDWRSSVWGDSTTRIYPEMGADRPALAPEPFAEAAAYRCVTQSPHAWRTSLRRASRSGR